MSTNSNLESYRKFRFSLFEVAKGRAKVIAYLLKKGKFKMAYNTLWVTLFTRDSGAALLDPIYRLFPWIVRFPKAIEVEVTTRCHLRCTMCEHTYWDEPPRDMTLEEFKMIVDQFPDLKWINITGIGSNFLNKDFLDIIRYLKSRSIYVEFFDTFTLLNQKIIRELVEIGVDKIWLSLDAATKETYEKIRIGADFNKVIRNVKALSTIKKEMRSPIPELWFHYVITKENLHEMPQYVELVHSLTENTEGVLIYWTGLLAFSKVDHLVVEEIPSEILNEVLKKSRDLHINMWWNQNLAPCEPITKCVRWTEPFILVTGHVQPCCVINEANQRKFQKEYALGNLFEKPFSEVWNNEYKKLVGMMRKNIVPQICKYCRAYDLSKSRIPKNTIKNLP